MWVLGLFYIYTWSKFTFYLFIVLAHVNCINKSEWIGRIHAKHKTAIWINWEELTDSLKVINKRPFCVSLVEFYYVSIMVQTFIISVCFYVIY